MSNIAGKIWGQTELIHKNGVLEFHRIDYKAGYKCSEHEHKYKWNGFFVESGKMLVREGLEDGVAFELYWAEFNHDDIVRRTSGTVVDNKVVRLDTKKSKK